jgi:hypothetical protein
MNSSHQFAFVDCEGLDSETAYRLIVGSLVPRSIAWMTAMGEDARIVSLRMRPVAQLGVPFYAKLGDIYQRPMPPQPPVVGISLSDTKEKT